MQVLLVEDHTSLARDIRSYLECEGWSVATTGSGTEGLRLALEQAFGVVLLDLSLPGLDGIEVCRGMRAAGVDTPVLMLTARSGKPDVVAGLACGADDYLTKPFALEELVARVRALVRRTGSTRSPVITVGDVTIDTNARAVTKGDRPVHLAPREYALLEHLARNRGVVQDRTALLEEVWGEPDGLLFSQTVDVHVAYLRRKLGRGVISTVPGAGYMVPDA